MSDANGLSFNLVDGLNVTHSLHDAYVGRSRNLQRNIVELSLDEIYFGPELKYEFDGMKTGRLLLSVDTLAEATQLLELEGEQIMEMTIQDGRASIWTKTRQFKFCISIAESSLDLLP